MTAPTSLALPPTLRPEGRRHAVELLRQYFGPVTSDQGFPGAHFERLGGGGDRPAVAQVFTAEDFVAVGLLGVVVPPRAALALLGPRRSELNALLAEVPTGTELVDVEPAEITPAWAPWRLWEALHSLDDVDGVVAGTLIARKRPRLVPVYDQSVQDLLMPTEMLWVSLAKELRADGGALQAHLIALRDEAGIGEDISALRVFHVVGWMTARELSSGG